MRRATSSAGPSRGTSFLRACWIAFPLRALAYFPLPNTPSTSITETNNWFAQGISQSVNRQMSLKMDHNFSDRSRLNGRYSYGPYTTTPPNLFGELAPSRFR